MVVTRGWNGEEEMKSKDFKAQFSKMNKFWRFDLQHGDYRKQY
jgi:hypothetical protein